MATETTTLTPTESRTPTPTQTPDEILSVALEVIRRTADATCVGDYYPIPKRLTISCSQDACGFDCDHVAGHRGGGSLARFPSRFTAANILRLDAFEGVETYSGSDFLSYFYNNGARRGGALQANCWLARATSFDDTDFRIAPQPESVIRSIYEESLALGLFDLCPPLPSPIEIAGEILTGFVSYAYCPAGPLSCGSSGCSFDCQYGPGHEGSISIIQFATEAEAETAFTRKTIYADVPAEDFHGFPAVFWSRDYYGFPPGGDEFTFGVWRAGCWVVDIQSFDDTHYRSAPIPRAASETIYQSGTAAGIFSTCRP